MSLASTSSVLVRILGEDLLTPAVSTASASMSKLDQVNKQVTSSTSQLAAAEKYGVNLTSNASVAFGIAKAAANDFGNALNHAKGFVSNLVQGPLGMVGLGVAAFSLAGALKSGIDTANTLAIAIEKLVPITGNTAEQVSALIAVFEKFGVSSEQATTSLAMMEKNAFNLTVTTQKATAFQKEFGVSLVDSTGHVKDANAVLAIAADYFNSNASSAEKAAFESKLFGRNWQAMIPILQQGSAGLTEAEQHAAALGETLGTADVKALQQYQIAMRDAGAAVDGLKLQLALALIPTLTDLATTLTKFVTDHRTDIKQFFLGAVAAARTVGAALLQVGQFAKSAWDTIPGPLQTLMIQALIGNKVIKTVFGINILGSVEGVVAAMGKDVLGKVFSSLLGKTIATPVVNVDGAVVNVAGGVPGGGGLPGVPPVGGGPADVVTNLGPGGEVGILAKLTPVAIGIGVATAERPMFQQGMALLNAKIAAANAAGAAQITGNAQKIGNSQLGAAVLLTNLMRSASSIQAAIMNKLVGATNAQTQKVVHSAELSMILSREQHKVTYAELVKDAHNAHLDHLSEISYASKQLTKAGSILTSSESVHKKIVDLNVIQANFARRGDTASAAKITTDILKLLPPLDSIAGEMTAIKNQTAATLHDVSELNGNALPPKKAPAKLVVKPTSKSTSSAQTVSQRLGGP